MTGPSVKCWCTVHTAIMGRSHRSDRVYFLSQSFRRQESGKNQSLIVESSPLRRDIVPVLTHHSIPFNSGFALWEQKPDTRDTAMDQGDHSNQSTYPPSRRTNPRELGSDHADIRQRGRLRANERVVTCICKFG